MPREPMEAASRSSTNSCPENEAAKNFRLVPLLGRACTHACAAVSATPQGVTKNPQHTGWPLESRSANVALRIFSYSAPVRIKGLFSTSCEICMPCSFLHEAIQQGQHALLLVRRALLLVRRALLLINDKRHQHGDQHPGEEWESVHGREKGGAGACVRGRAKMTAH